MATELALIHDQNLLGKKFNLPVRIRKLPVRSIELGLHGTKLILQRSNDDIVLNNMRMKYIKKQLQLFDDIETEDAK